MDLFSFPPIAAVLGAAYALVQGLMALFNPIAGSTAAAVAIVALTVLVRSALIPVGVSQVKAEWARRRLAPRLQALQRRYKKHPQLLQEKTLALYRDEKVSPFAGMLPTLAQAPVLSLVYALFLRTTIDAHGNALLSEHLFGVPLGTSLLHLLSAAPSASGLAVYAVLLCVMATTAWLTRRTARVLAQPTDAGAPLAGLAGILSWIPFITVVFAAFVPLAAALYLVTTTAWTLIERALLRRRYWGENFARNRPGGQNGTQNAVTSGT